MELPESKIDELFDLLANKVKISEKIEVTVMELIKNRFELLEQDVVLKQRRRFEQLEVEVKILLE